MCVCVCVLCRAANAVYTAILKDEMKFDRLPDPASRLFNGFTTFTLKRSRLHFLIKSAAAHTHTHTHTHEQHITHTRGLANGTIHPPNIHRIVFAHTSHLGYTILSPNPHGSCCQYILLLEFGACFRKRLGLGQNRGR